MATGSSLGRNVGILSRFPAALCVVIGARRGKPLRARPVVSRTACHFQGGDRSPAPIVVTAAAICPIVALSANVNKLGSSID